MRAACCAGLLGRGVPGERPGVDADGKDLDHGFPAVGAHPVRGEDAAARLVLDVVEEAVPVRLGLEADHVVGEQRADEHVVRRQRGEDFPSRERNVEEEAHRVVAPHAPQLLAARDEVVVVDPDVVARGQQGQKGVGESAG